MPEALTRADGRHPDDPTGLRTRSISGEQFADRDAAAYRKLLAIVRTTRAAAFVGAGVSIRAGFPSWRELLDRLKQNALSRDATLAEQLLDIEEPLQLGHALKAAYASVGRDEFRNAFGRIFHKAPREFDQDRYPHLRPFHRTLVRLPFALWSTTNYDKVLEQAAELEFPNSVRSQAVSSVCIHGGDSLPLSGAFREDSDSDAESQAAGPRSVIHWHGVYSAEPTIVLGSGDYEDAYGFERGGGDGFAPARPLRATRLLTAMTAIMATRRMVFVGFSLRDPYVTNVLEKVATLLWDWGRPVHAAILSLEVGDGKQELVQRQLGEERLEAHGIFPVWYPVADKDHSALEVLVEAIAKDIASEAATNSSAATQTSLPVGTPDASSSRESGPEATTSQQPQWLRRNQEFFLKRVPRDAD